MYRPDGRHTRTPERLFAYCLQLADEDQFFI